MENFQFLKLKIETWKCLVPRIQKMRKVLLLYSFYFMLNQIFAYTPIQVPHRLVNYVARGTLNYYRNFVNKNDLRQEIWAHFYENQNEPELQKLLFRNAGKYSSRERRKKLKTKDLIQWKINKYYEYENNFYPDINYDNLSSDEQILVDLLLQKKSTLEIMDTLKCTFPKYKKYISKIRKKISFQVI
jgi:hypothetical protein